MADNLKNNLHQGLEQALRDKDLPIGIVPNLDLYMDQVISLFQQEIEPVDKDRALTKTMINNYSKEGLLLSIKGKKYSPAHILQMQMICNLKQTLPMSEIKKLLTFAQADLVEADGKTYDKAEVFKLNKAYLDSREQMRQQLTATLDGLYADCCSKETLTPKEQRVFDVLFLATVSAYTQKAALAMLACMD